jgi:hypothetical protein
MWSAWKLHFKVVHTHWRGFMSISVCENRIYGCFQRTHCCLLQCYFASERANSKFIWNSGDFTTVKWCHTQKSIRNKDNGLSDSQIIFCLFVEQAAWWIFCEPEEYLNNLQVSASVTTYSCTDLNISATMSFFFFPGPRTCCPLCSEPPA